MLVWVYPLTLSLFLGAELNSTRARAASRVTPSPSRDVSLDGLTLVSGSASGAITACHPENRSPGVPVRLARTGEPAGPAPLGPPLGLPPLVTPPGWWPGYRGSVAPTPPVGPND